MNIVTIVILSTDFLITVGIRTDYYNYEMGKNGEAQ